MMQPEEGRSERGSPLAWLCAVLAGAVVPVAALLLLVDAPAATPFPLSFGPVLAVGLMGMGMISAAAAGRLWIGVVLAVSVGAGLLLLARMLGLVDVPHPLLSALAMIIASISFAARGALFARSAAGRGWWIALFVVLGEAAIVLTATARPGALPDWLLALLPAQWASAAIRTTLVGSGGAVAASELLALAGTAAATLLVARLWPRRWPYLVMFTMWLGLSALVWYLPAPPMPDAMTVTVAAPATSLDRSAANP